MAKSEVYINKNMNDALTKLADKKGVTKAAALNNLLENAGVGNDKVNPVVLHLPVELLAKNKEALTAWLEHRSSGIVKHFYPQ